MVPRPSALFVSTAALLSTAAFAAPTRSSYQEPLEDGTLGEPPVAKYPFKNDPYDRKHDTYGEGVQPLPIVRVTMRLLRLKRNSVLLWWRV